jgi:hypothetical protein
MGARFCYAVVYADGIFGLLHDIMMMAARCSTNPQHEARTGRKSWRSVGPRRQTLAGWAYVR